MLNGNIERNQKLKKHMREKMKDDIVSMKKKSKILDVVIIGVLFFLLGLSLLGCATHPDKIGAAHVSSVEYATYDCVQLVSERARISREEKSLRAQMQQKRSSDTGLMIAGLFVWPAWFFVDGESVSDNSKLADLMGSLEAIDQTKITKKCEG